MKKRLQAKRRQRRLQQLPKQRRNLTIRRWRILQRRQLHQWLLWHTMPPQKINIDPKQ